MLSGRAAGLVFRADCRERPFARPASGWVGFSQEFPSPLLAWSGGVLLLASMAPGSGIRTWLVHLQHWSEVEYSSPQS